jgi:hypothetical protein
LSNRISAERMANGCAELPAASLAGMIYPTSQRIMTLLQHRSGFKASDHAGGQGVPRAESGAYTIVREHFRSRDNAAIRRKTGFLLLRQVNMSNTGNSRRGGAGCPPRRAATNFSNDSATPPSRLKVTADRQRRPAAA